LVAFGCLVVGLGILLYKQLKNQQRESHPVHFQRVGVTKLTTTGNAIMAALSPDGKYLAYVVSEAGNQSLWLRQVAITSNVQLVSPREGRYLGIAFSPDGNFLYYGYQGNGANDSAEAYRMPVLGSSNTAIKIDLQNGPVSVSHNGKRIAYIHYDRENQADALVVSNPDGSNQQELTRHKWPDRLAWGWDTMPAWTAADDALAVPLVKSDPNGYYFMIFEVSVATRAERIVPLSSQRFGQPGDVKLLPDASGIMVSAEAYGASFPQIWLLSRDGSARSITNDLSDYRGMSLRADGRAFATVQRQTLSRIWTIPKGETDGGRPLTSGTSRYFDLCWAPDGKIVYASDASGSADIYEIDADGGSPRQLTSDAKRNYGPTVSPDGHYIAIHSNRSGIFQIWRMDRDGANAKQLTFGDRESNWPAFSADGKWVVYEHFEENARGTVWKVPIEGGTSIQGTDVFSIRPAVSPDGKWIAFWRNEGQPGSRWQLGVMPFSGNGSTKIFDVSPTVQVQWDTPLRWTSDSRFVTYPDHRGGIDNVVGHPIDGSPAKPLTTFKDGQIFSFAWSKDGNLVASRGAVTSDVVLMADLDR